MATDVSSSNSLSLMSTIRTFGLGFEAGETKPFAVRSGAEIEKAKSIGQRRSHKCEDRNTALFDVAVAAKCS